MNLQFYLEKLFNSEEFKSFMKENKEAYFCSGFFVIDKDGNDNKQHIDYFVPSSGKTFSFQMEEEIKLIPLEQADVKIPEKIPESLDINLDYVEKLILGEMFE